MKATLIRSAVLLLCATAAGAQTSIVPASRDWNALAQVAPGTELRIRYSFGSTSCAFESVDAARITCVVTRRVLFFPVSHLITAPRAAVRQVRLGHLTRSVLVGSALDRQWVGELVPSPTPLRRAGKTGTWSRLQVCCSVCR